jgi:hypothetical protein
VELKIKLWKTVKNDIVLRFNVGWSIKLHAESIPAIIRFGKFACGLCFQDIPNSV